MIRIIPIQNIEHLHFHKCNFIVSERFSGAKAIYRLLCLERDGRNPWAVFSSSLYIQCNGIKNGYPHKFPCLENPLEKGAWWSTLHRVAKSSRRLSTHAYISLMVRLKTVLFLFWYFFMLFTLKAYNFVLFCFYTSFNYDYLLCGKWCASFSPSTTCKFFPVAWNRQLPYVIVSKDSGPRDIIFLFVINNLFLKCPLVWRSN